MIHRFVSTKTLRSLGGAACLLFLPHAPGALAATINPDSASDPVDFFEKNIRPVLANKCYSCHSADTKPSGGLRVDDRNGLLVGGNTGPALVSGDPDKSLLLERILTHDTKKRMPKEGELLTDTEVANFNRWIKDGVAWPRERIPASIGGAKPEYANLKARHWAWQRLKDPKAPAVKDSRWPKSDLDRFILAKLEAAKLHPVKDADPETLIRRVAYDLTGLPPTPAEIESFLADKSPEAFSHVVDRLLASPRFGERWGRHWLDVARYAESSGPSRNIPYPHAWKYRDYVIDAVNRDVPFDRFVQEQVAGDLLPAPSPVEKDRLLTATGFLAIGAKDVNQRFKVRFLMDNVDEQIDTVTRSVLALTVSCARCHDHKFDPIPVTDYYSLAGIFTSTDDCAGVRNKMGGGGLDYYDPQMLVTLASVKTAPPDKVEELKKKLDEAKKAWDAIRGTTEGLSLAADGKPKQRPFRLKYEALQKEYLALTDPGELGYAVHGLRDAKIVGDTEVRIRGQAERIGPTVPRGYLTAFEVPEAPRVNPAQSGRLELAQWLTSPNNPVTPRVIVNRVWNNLIGQGIVTTVDNFGIKGDVPSDPELLDALASGFIRDHWSVKRLVRRIVLSRAYQLGSETPAPHLQIDPANHLVWRHAPRRLEAEEVRDSLLASAGRLQVKPPSGSPVKALKMIEMADNGSEARTIHEQADRSVYRSVYLPLLRGVIPATLEAFDPVEQSLVTGRRDATTVPTQALYLLNSSFVRRQSLALADRLLNREAPSDTERIKTAYLLTLDRKPERKEISRAENYLRQYESSFRAWIASEPPSAPEPTRPKPAAKTGDATADDNAPAPEPTAPEPVDPRTPQEAAWSSFIQALYASAEFRFVR